MAHPVAISVLVLSLLPLACGVPAAGTPSSTPTGAGTSPTPGVAHAPAPNGLLPLDADARSWVDSALAALDTRERAGQLVMPWMWGRYVPTGDAEWERLRHWVQDLGVGGLITSIGPPVALADKLNRLQRLADLPLLISADLEAGPGMRLDGGTLLPWGLDMGGGTDFPPVMSVGATGRPALAYEMGRVTAVEGRAVGIHMSFAPVVDVNNNPANPIINVRSYGGDPTAVAEFGVAHLRGLQEHGMLAVAKHFPGHGDVEEDTHLVPLSLQIGAARADSVELVPYRAVIGAGVAGVMSAHIAFPALSGHSTLPATLSPRMLDSLLVRELGFEGLVITDALNMGAIVARFGAGEAAVLALEAGADILLQPADPAVTIAAVTEAVASGRISGARLERSVRKVLEAKARMGVHRRRLVDVGAVADVVGDSSHRSIAARVAEASITLARDRGRLVPLDPVRDRRVLLLSSSDEIDPFAGRTLAAELATGLPSVRHVRLGPGAPPAAVLDSLVSQADSADLVILAIDARVRGGLSAALDTVTAGAFRRIAGSRPTILVSFRSPYLVQELPEVGTYLLGWSSTAVSQVAVARALLGRAAIDGRLPIAVPPDLPRGAGLVRLPGPTPSHGHSLSPVALDSLAATVRAAVDAGITPGAVVAVGRSRGEGWVRAFGRTGRHPNAPAVTDSTLYDLASLTKVVGTTTAVMRLVDERRMELDAPLSRYLPEWPSGGWRDSVTIRRLLTHSAGLPAFVRFWHPSEGALRGRDRILTAIVDTEPDYAPGVRTVYSDLGAILLGAAVEAVAGATLDVWLGREVWQPLEMDRTTFTPGARHGPGAQPLGAPGVDADLIAPTELDTVFRHTHVHGEVHDENAWAMGGVAGHAGLFSTAPDLARFARMLLQGGIGGEGRMLRESTIAAFTRPAEGGGRGLGWDAAPGTSIAEPFSPRAFGHTGFTGTSLWIDPDRDLYVVLLTNRVNPTRAQGGIQDLRRSVHAWAVEAVDGQLKAGGGW